MIQGQLQRLGIDVTLASNGVKALEALQSGKFDLVLCDCAMPEMDGYDFTRTLRRQEPAGVRIPVIALTANESPEDATECSLAGMDDFISKPVTAERLATVLGKWLQSSIPQATASATQQDAGLAPGVINLRVLSESLGTNEITALHRVLEESLATVAVSLSEVEAAANSGDPARLTSAVQNAKGEARCVAAIGLANLYAELERHTKDGNRAATRDLIARAAVEVRRVEEFIRGQLGARA